MPFNRLVAAIGLVNCFIHLALPIQAHPNEMSFSKVENDVFADGTITPGTTERFLSFVRGRFFNASVYFNSPGGSLVEGIKLGKAIRRLGFSTGVAKWCLLRISCTQTC
jgi:hypothetical protein